jgi:hypothetical protein
MRTPRRPLTDDHCDACISRYTRDGVPAVTEWCRRLKELCGGDRRLMMETERLTPAVSHRQIEGD